MNRLRLWILGCALGCFAAGMTAGLAIPEVLQACCGSGGTQDPDEAFVRGFVADFKLDAKQQRLLRMVLASRYQSEREALFRGTNYDKLPDELKNELGKASTVEEQRIRALLTPEQRQRYDEKVQQTKQVKHG